MTADGAVMADGVSGMATTHLPGLWLISDIGAAQISSRVRVDGEDVRSHAVGEAGVGVIDVNGAMSDRNEGRFFFAPATYEEIEAAVAELLGNAAVKGILLRFNSPGGVVPQLFETAQAIAEAGRVKPVYALIQNQGTSAAYALAVGAEKVFATTNAMVGSIGTKLEHFDVSEMNKRIGIKITEYKSGSMKTIGSEDRAPTAEEDRWFKDLIEGTANQFVDWVTARREGVSREDVLATKAAPMLGAEAAQKGFVDGVATYGEVLDMLMARVTTAAGAGEGEREMATNNDVASGAGAEGAVVPDAALSDRAPDLPPKAASLEPAAVGPQVDRKAVAAEERSKVRAGQKKIAGMMATYRVPAGLASAVADVADYDAEQAIEVLQICAMSRLEEEQLSKALVGAENAEALRNRVYEISTSEAEQPEIDSTALTEWGMETPDAQSRAGKILIADMESRFPGSGKQGVV